MEEEDTPARPHPYFKSYLLRLSLGQDSCQMPSEGNPVSAGLSRPKEYEAKRH